MNKLENAIVIFGEDIPGRLLKSKNPTNNVVIAKEELRQGIESIGFKFVSIEPLIEAGSIYEAGAFAEELSRLILPEGSRVSKSFIYKGYELWWIHYNSLYIYFCLPYTQYRKLLVYLKNFHKASFYKSPYQSLFSCYLNAHGCETNILRETRLKTFIPIPFGVFIQILITILSIPILVVGKRSIMLFTGDELEKYKDYDFRMKFIYEELRRKKLPFVEFIRSLESWKTVLMHIIKRRRPVIYSSGVAFVGQFISVISGGNRRARRRFGANIFESETDPDVRFKLLVTTQYLAGIYGDVWSIRIMKWILRTINIKTAIISTAMERNFHAVFGCKLNSIPTVGILHGISIRHYNTYDFLPSFDGEKQLSIDKYGLWSEWWKEYYTKYSRIYNSEQLYVSGPMRPSEIKREALSFNQEEYTGPIRILIISEQLAVPSEVIPYIEALLQLPTSDFVISFRFRPSRDGFQQWLTKHRPDFLNRDNVKISKGTLQDVIRDSDVVIGSHSTAVLEALFEFKPIVFFHTQKWGDYLNLKDYDSHYKFFAENPRELIDCIKKSREIPLEILEKLQNRFFGDPYKNGSKWVVDEAEKLL